MIRTRRLYLVVTVAALALLSGCGGSDEGSGPAVLTVYVSLPVSGPAAADGRDATDGALLALADAGGEAGGARVEAQTLDAGAPPPGWTPAISAENARTASRDSTAIAYLGDLQSGATRASLPITNHAFILQVSPASEAADLVSEFRGSSEISNLQTTGERTFGRVLPPGASSALPPAGREFATRFEQEYGRSAGRYAASGYEAMAVILDAIDRADDPEDREAVVDAFFETADRDSILGRYSITEEGETTLAEDP